MSKGIIDTIAGVAAIATGVALEILVGWTGIGAIAGAALISAGTGLVMTGIGTMLSKGPLGGFATTLRNPTAPWEIVYGRARVGGTIVYLNGFGNSNNFLDMVIVLAAHSCQSVDAVLFDNHRVQIGAHNTSFSPLQQNINITSIVRVGNVVTVSLNQNIPLLQDGDFITISGVHPVSANLNGNFQVTIISQVFGGPGSIVFSYLSGGIAISIPSYPGSESGSAHTTWVNYSTNVYMEAMLGTQTLGTTFAGMTNGTPSHGDPGNLVTPENQDNSVVNPWTSYCSLVGKTAVFLRLQYDPKFFPAGIPQISFWIHGKNDIQDPRTSPPTVGYTENAALVIADYLSNTIWGFKAGYGTEINLPNLIAAANICDEAVALAFPVVSPPNTEPRYAANGHFNLTMKRGEILQNLLTSMAGRITYEGGQFSIWPAIWPGVSLSLASTWVNSNAAGSIKWKPTVSVSSLYNGVKGTYISPVNSWQSSDFPPYAQDALHGYNDGSPLDDYDLNLTNDGGDRRWLDIQLPFTISCPCAQRLAKIELMRRRQQGTGTFLLNMAGYQIAPMDVIQMSLTYFGWADKYLEVLACRFKLEKQQDSGGVEIVLLGTEIDVQESDPSVYDWEVIEELSPQGYQQPGVYDTLLTPDPPSNLALGFDGSGYPILTWTAPQDAFVTEIQAEYQLIASPPGLWIALPSVDKSVTQMTLPELIPGNQYVIQIRSVNVAGVTSAWVPIDYTPLSLPPQWAPAQIQGTVNDSLFPNEYSFEIEIDYGNSLGNRITRADGSALPRVNVTGVEPVNKVIANCPPPVITGYSTASTGGFLPRGTTLYCTVTADDGNGNYTLPAAVFPVFIPFSGTDTNTLTLSVMWPNFSGLTEYTIYASPSIDLVCAQVWGQALTPVISSPPPANPYSPGSVTLAADQSPPSTVLSRLSWAPPNPNLRVVEMKMSLAYHAGVVGAGIDSVTGNTIVSGATIDVASIDNWTGRSIFLIGRNGAPVPFWARSITAFNPSTGAFTFSGPAISSPPAVNDPQPDDVFAVSTLGYDNSANRFEAIDAGWSNAGNYNFATQVSTPHSGLTVNLEQGLQLLVISGTSRGAKANVLANTGTAHILDTAIVLDATSVWIIVESGYAYTMQSRPLSNPNPFQEMTLAKPVDNIQGTLLVRGFLVDFTGQICEDGDGPFRLVYLPGVGLNIQTVTSGATPLMPTTQVIVGNASGGPFTKMLPSPASVIGRRLTLKKDSSSNPVTFTTPSGTIQ